MSNQELKRCDFKDCEKYSRARKGGLCGTHCSQLARGEELRPIRARRSRYGEICSYPDCGLPHFRKGYCSGHSWQVSQGREPTPIEARNGWMDGFKACPGCSEVKGEDDYPRDASKSSGYSTYCRECSRWKQIGSKYNLTRDEWIAIFEYQGGCCAICGEEDPGSALGWATDHDHDCCDGQSTCGRCVRTILCVPCNLRADRSEAPTYVAYRKRSKARGIPLVDLVMRRYQLSA